MPGFEQKCHALAVTSSLLFVFLPSKMGMHWRDISRVGLNYAKWMKGWESPIREMKGGISHENSTSQGNHSASLGQWRRGLFASLIRSCCWQSALKTIEMRTLFSKVWRRRQWGKLASICALVSHWVSKMQRKTDNTNDRASIYSFNALIKQ